MQGIENKIILTGIKPTDHVHLGNYLGAIRPGIELVNSSKSSLLFIADYHALTTVQDPQSMRDFTYSVAAAWIACGLDPKKTLMYRQSDIPEIFELAWVLACVTPKGFMNRAHAYKAKLQENLEAQKEDPDFGVSMGSYFYPVLMAADILLFNTDVVPVGEDQVQHVEFARDMAQKFNRIFKAQLKMPQHLVKTEKVIPGLDGRKMSKSYGNHVPLFLESTELRKMTMKIVTDSLPPEAPKDTQNSVPFMLYKEFASADEVEQMKALYQKGVGWGEVKQKLYEAMDRYFADKAKVYHELMANKDQLEAILQDGAVRARQAAQKTMSQVRAAVMGR